MRGALLIPPIGSGDMCSIEPPDIEPIAMPPLAPLSPESPSRAMATPPMAIAITATNNAAIEIAHTGLT